MNTLMSIYAPNVNSYSGHAHNWKLSVEEHLKDYPWLVDELGKCSRDAGIRLLEIDGEGRSGYVGRVWENNLGLVGIKAVHYHRARAPGWVKGDLYGALTGSGKTSSVLNRIKLARSQGVTTWAMFSESEPNEQGEHVSQFSLKNYLVPGREEAVGERSARKSRESLGALRTYSEHSFALSGFSIPMSVYESQKSKKPVEEIIRDNTYRVADYVSEVVYDTTKKDFRDNINIMLEECPEKKLLILFELGPYIPIERTLEVRTMHTGFDDRGKTMMVMDLEKYKNIQQLIGIVAREDPKLVGAIGIVDKYFLDPTSPFKGDELLKWFYGMNVDTYLVSSEILDKSLEEKARAIARFRGRSFPLDDNVSLELSALGSMVTIDAFLNCFASEEEMEKRHRRGE